jgi:hypothetical protein
VQAVEEKRALFTRMSKLSLQAEERESYLAHQRGVDEQRILRDVAETLAQSPLRASGSSASTVPVSVSARSALAPAVGRGGDALADQEEEDGTRHATATQKRVESKYLRSLVDDAHDTASAAREAAPKPATAHAAEPLTKSSQHLKAELSQLDSEIGRDLLCSNSTVRICRLLTVSQLIFPRNRGTEGKARQSRYAEVATDPE